MTGTKPNIKSDLHIKKMVNKFEKVSGHVLNSFNFELEQTEDMPQSSD